MQYTTNKPSTVLKDIYVAKLVIIVKSSLILILRMLYF